jgi:large subunit ribosomal protein L18
MAPASGRAFEAAMNSHKAKLVRRLRRRNHVRSRITGTPERPRLSVFRSSKHIYAQLIDDLAGETLVAVSSQTADVKKGVAYGGNVKAAKAVGEALASSAKAKGIVKAAFDRGHYKFHGRVKALAEAANAAGLKCCEHKPGKKIKTKPEAAKAEAKPAPKEKKEKKDKKEKQEKPAES